jgi:hypothetical protein
MQVDRKSFERYKDISLTCEGCKDSAHSCQHQVINIFHYLYQDPTEVGTRTDR